MFINFVTKMAAKKSVNHQVTEDGSLSNDVSIST